MLGGYGVYAARIYVLFRKYAMLRHSTELQCWSWLTRAAAGPRAGANQLR